VESVCIVSHDFAAQSFPGEELYQKNGAQSQLHKSRSRRAFQEELGKMMSDRREIGAGLKSNLTLLPSRYSQVETVHEDNLPGLAKSVTAGSNKTPSPEQLMFVVPPDMLLEVPPMHLCSRASNSPARSFRPTCDKNPPSELKPL
jgi:hypothetical protein